MQRRTFTTLAMATGVLTFSPIALRRARAAPETSSLSFGFGLDPVFAPHIMAMEKGWFAEAGFEEITTRSFTGGALAGEALISGDIQLWTPGNLPPISMAHSGIPMVVLGTNCIASAADKFVARKDAEVRRPEDLYDITIGLLAGSTASAVLHNIAERYGLDEDRIEVVNMPPPEQLSSLNAGTIDALICWEPWGHNAVAQGVGELIHTGDVSYFEDNHGEPAKVSATRSVFVASQEFVRANPEATRLLMQTLVRAQRYVADDANRDEVLPLTAEGTEQDPALVEAIWDEYDFDPTFDEAYVEDMRTLTDFLVASGRVDEAIDPLDYTYTDPVASADAALIKVEGRWQP